MDIGTESRKPDLRTISTGKRPVDWLHKTRRFRRKRPYRDTELLKLIMGQRETQFTKKRFDKIFDLTSIENQERLDAERFDRALQFTELRPYIEGDNLSEQVNTLVRTDTPSELREPLTHILCRIILGNAPVLLGNWDVGEVPPKRKGTDVKTRGLDIMSAALLSIHSMMDLTDQKVWMETLSDPLIWTEPMTMWDKVTTRLDGSIVSEWEEYLLRLRCKVNLMHFEPLVKLTSILSKKKTRQKLSQRILTEKLRESEKTNLVLPYLLTETFMPSFEMMGLRYRFVLSPLERKNLWSPGVIDRIVLRDMEGPKDDFSAATQYRAMTIHLEPVGSPGPERSRKPKNAFEVIAAKETLSFRLDMFDRNQGYWSFGEPSEKLESRKKQKPSLLHSSVSSSKKPIVPAQRIIDILSILWTHRGNIQGNNRIMQAMGVSKSVQDYSESILFKKKYLSVMYHPILDFVGLPEGVLVIISDLTAHRLEICREWLLSNTPYIHIIENPNDGCLVAFARLPLFESGSWTGLLLHDLANIGSHIVQPIERHITYRLTALNRIYDPEAQNWLDPWSL